MKIAFIGAGGVGGYFGAKLARSGEKVTLLARGKHLEAMRRNGLTIQSAAGDFRLQPVDATDDPAQAGTADLVVIAVKNWDLEGAARTAGRLLGSKAEIVCLQNGVEAAETVARETGSERVLGGVAHISAAILSPGVIRHAGTLARIRLGRFDGTRSEIAEEFVAACGRAGLDAAVSPDIRRAIWEKFLLLTSLSGMTAIARLPVGPVRKNPETRELLRRAMSEVAAVAAGRGVSLPEDAVERHMAFCDALPDDSVPSMLYDLRAGHKLELPWLSGAVARLGREAQVPTPVHSFIASVLHLHAAGGG